LGGGQVAMLETKLFPKLTISSNAKEVLGNKLKRE
jgi:hypothetical protein